MNAPDPNSSPLYSAPHLIEFARSLFAAAGCESDKASRVAEILVEGDLLGATTHGLAQAAGYLEELQNGRMLAAGTPTTIADRPAAVVWDGRYLPGPWLTAGAVDLACERASQYGVCAVTIQRSHHIACLSAYLQRATRRGLMLIIATSDPSAASVAPFGGLKAVFTPDPIAVGIPTSGDPILIDMSSSITTNGLSSRLFHEGSHFPGLWALDAAGSPTDDPAVLFKDPPGTILPSGGVDHGHKGYGLALLVEALTQGLAGFGRAETPSEWGGSVFIQALDPGLFAGLPAYRREMDWIAQACRDNPPVRPDRPVRLPGQAELSRRRVGLEQGLSLYPGIIESLAPWAQKYGIQLPTPLPAFNSPK